VITTPDRPEVGFDCVRDSSGIPEFAIFGKLESFVGTVVVGTAVVGGAVGCCGLSAPNALPGARHGVVSFGVSVTA
jgi:hypothetical protein